MSELEYFKQWAAGRYPQYPQTTQCGSAGIVYFVDPILQGMWCAFLYRNDIRPTTTMKNGVLDKAEFGKDDPGTLVDRLRGIYPVPVPGRYRTAPIQHEAAREIERLRKDAQRYQYLRENLNRLQGMRPYHAPEPEKLDAAIDAALTDVQK